MRYRTFGRTGWSVSDVGYGMWGMGGWTGSDDDESLQSLHRAVELGCNFFDTAWAYGAGHSEKLLGQLVRAYPDRKLYVATKIPPKNFKWPSRRGYTLDDNFPGRSHPGVHREEPAESGAGQHRSDAVPRVGRRLGATTSAGRRPWRSQARGVDQSDRGQHQPLGTG